MNNEKKPFTLDKKKGLALLIVFLILTLVVAYRVSRAEPIPATNTTNSQFVLASWSYPDDEYGQGILSVFVYENSTGSWVEIPESHFDPDDPSSATVNGSLALKVGVFYVINHTLFGLGGVNDAKLIIRGSVEMLCLGESVFFQQNLTYYDSGNVGATCWWLGYEAVIDFILVAGDTYTVELTYDIYW